MTSKEILTKVINKAVNNGYEPESDIYEYEREIIGIIFSHPFLKAFFGEETKMDGDGYQPQWQYHAQQMVISEDPIKYLEQYL